MFYSIPLTLGIVLGQFLGKQLGICGMIWLAVRLRICVLPEGLDWKQMYGVALLAGIGFTMSLFITTLAFVDVDMLAMARFAIIIGSHISGAVGLSVFYRSKVIPTKAGSSIKNEVSNPSVGVGISKLATDESKGYLCDGLNAVIQHFWIELWVLCLKLTISDSFSNETGAINELPQSFYRQPHERQSQIVHYQ